VDILVNNAGIVLAYEAIHETDMAQWAKVVAVNQMGTFLGMRAVIPHMMRAGGGSIVKLVVDLGQRPRAGRRGLPGGQGGRPQHDQECRRDVWQGQHPG